VNVHFTNAANENLIGIHNYIAKNSVRYAQITVDRITRRAERLSEDKLPGWMVAEYQDPTVREVLMKPYRIIFRILLDRIDVLAIIHGAKELPTSLP
jgi:toxin ParE1/3/4